MTRHNSDVTEAIIKKIHHILADSESGEDIIDFLRAAEPTFMKEVGRFVQIEVEKIRKDFSEDFLLYFGSVIGAAYIMGFLIAREVDHKIYDKYIPIESMMQKALSGMSGLSGKEVDGILDKHLDEGKNPKEIGKIIHKYFSEGRKAGIKEKKKKPSKNNYKVDFNEGEL